MKVYVVIQNMMGSKKDFAQTYNSSIDLHEYEGVYNSFEEARRRSGEHGLAISQELK